jgi:hypothetical protein
MWKKWPTPIRGECCSVIRLEGVRKVTKNMVPLSYTPRIEAIFFSETFVTINQITQLHIPENSNHNVKLQHPVALRRSDFTFRHFFCRLCATPAVAWWLRHYAASRKVAGSSPDEVDFLKFTYSFRPHYGPVGRLSL